MLQGNQVARRVWKTSVRKSLQGATEPGGPARVLLNATEGPEHAASPNGVAIYQDRFTMPGAHMEHVKRWLLLVAAAVGLSSGHAADNIIAPSKTFLEWAARPPMGWNSWDCFGCTVTEDLTRANADYMAEKLARHGWEYIVVDIQWYEPQSTGWNYSPNPKPVLDEYGRLWPVPAKFPSSTEGRGFKPLADYVHSKGLKFGVHLMRGIPREAVRRNTRILGSDRTAAQIADTNSTCSWNPDMYGVDMSKPGAQEYYDSVFQLLASWGVDYVKVDDIARPYSDHRPEIEAIRKAIDRSGRPMVLSLSPGPTPLSEGPHVIEHANLWRLTDDFWDEWRHLRAAFDMCHRWTRYRGPGHWPDPDMLPLGAIRVGPKMERNWTRFSRDEQRMLMTLWCISRAPLMFGGHLPWNDDWTLSLITNDEVLAVNQNSTGNRQLARTNDLVVWTAEAPGSPDRFVAFFNVPEREVPFDPAKALFTSPVLRAYGGPQTVSIRAPIDGAKTLYLVVDDAGDGNSFDHAAWIEPKLVGPSGELKLTELKWKSATAGYREVRVDRTVDNRPLTIDGQAASGIGTHSTSVIEYELPPGYTSFEATGALGPGARGRSSVRFEVYRENSMPSDTDRMASIEFKELGFTGAVRVRDLWERRDLGTFEGRYQQPLAWRGAAFLRLSPVNNSANR